MPRDRLVLLAALALVGVVELVGIALGRDTISALVRDVFHVHTAPGHAAFAAAWPGFAWWFYQHITQY